MKKLIFVLVVLTSLNGCAEMQERIAKRNQARLEAQCSSYGYTPGTDPFANCMMQVDQNTHQRNVETLRNLQQQNAALFQNNQQNQQVAPMPYLRAPVTTNCTGYGNTLTCTTR